MTSYSWTTTAQNQPDSMNLVMPHNKVNGLTPTGSAQHAEMERDAVVDALLLAIYHLYLYFLKEVKRGRAGLGSCRLRADQQKMAQ